MDISLERVFFLPGVAAADGVDPPRDDARGLDDSIAVVADCFDQVAVAHRVGIARGHIDGRTLFGTRHRQVSHAWRTQWLYRGIKQALVMKRQCCAHIFCPLVVLPTLTFRGFKDMLNVRRSRALGFAAATLFSVSALAIDLTGAGATFPYPIYAKWADAYKKETGVGMNYQSIGSGGGIKQITAKTVQFGASDMPMKPEELEKYGLMQFPAIMGGDVMVYNVKGVPSGAITLTGPQVADIYLGRIKKWNDPVLAKQNPGVKLPDQAISVVHRSDGSGTTFIFANYLSKVSDEWKTKVGEGTSVAWPTGVGGKGNEGVASYVQRIDGAIGYVEYAYAKQNKLSVAKMVNRDSQVVAPGEDTFKAAAASADWGKAPGMYLVLTDQAGKTSWPMTGASFILIHKRQERPELAKEVLKFFDWSFDHGDSMATELDYVPIPDSVVSMIRAAWKREIKDGAGKPLY